MELHAQTTPLIKCKKVMLFRILSGCDASPTAEWEHGDPGFLPVPPVQRALLPSLQQQMSEAYGFRGELWIRGRIAAVMRLACEMSSYSGHRGRVYKALGWSLYQPARRPRQRSGRPVFSFVLSPYATRGLAGRLSCCEAFDCSSFRR